MTDLFTTFLYGRKVISISRSFPEGFNVEAMCNLRRITHVSRVLFVLHPGPWYSFYQLCCDIHLPVAWGFWLMTHTLLLPQKMVLQRLKLPYLEAGVYRSLYSFTSRQDSLWHSSDFRHPWGIMWNLNFMWTHIPAQPLQHSSPVPLTLPSFSLELSCNKLYAHKRYGWKKVPHANQTNSGRPAW